jgi:uncharacterized membrane protein (Fun14 family)
MLRTALTTSSRLARPALAAGRLATTAAPAQRGTATLASALGRTSTAVAAAAPAARHGLGEWCGDGRGPRNGGAIVGIDCRGALFFFFASPLHLGPPPTRRAHPPPTLLPLTIHPCIHPPSGSTLPPLLKAASVAATVTAAYNPGPARADGGGFYPPPPPAARPEGFVARVTGGGKRLALSAVVGFLAGKVFQKVTATVFYSIVGLMLITQYLAYKGTLNVRWGGVFSKAARWLDLDRDGSFGIGDLKKAGWSGASIVARLVPSAGGFVAGFAYGVLG